MSARIAIPKSQAANANRWADDPLKERLHTMDFEKLLAQWSNEQGFTTWADDHAAVLRNLARWLDKNAAQQSVQADEVPECDCNTAQGFHEDSCAVTIFYAALRR